jgi:prepilin-type processing-associated H-X9-DG protein
MQISNICDGTSKTLLAGERIDQTGANGSLPFTSTWCGDVAFQDGYESTAIPSLLPSTLFPLNGSVNNPNCFGSRHTGGANFVLADGSLRFLNDRINLQVYQALGTPCGREIVALP